MTEPIKIQVEKKSHMRKLKDSLSTHKTVIVLGAATAVSVTLNAFAAKKLTDNMHVDVSIDPIEIDPPFAD